MTQNNLSKKRKDKKIYRISVLNDKTHEKLFGYKTTAGRLTLAIAAIIVLYTAIIVSLMAFSPLRKLIPGYPDNNIENMLIRNRIQRDSMAREMIMWDLYLSNVKKVMSGETPTDYQTLIKMRDSIIYTPDSSGRQISSDSIFTREMHKTGGKGKTDEKLENFHMFKPIEGIVTAHYNISANHPFTDIAATENSVVSSILPGTIISDEYSEEYGYSVQIQHSNNLVSVYRHLGTLLKKRGEKVEAGTAIALIAKKGGKVSTGPHLHLELWYDGEPVNPEKYIKF